MFGYLGLGTVNNMLGHSLVQTYSSLCTWKCEASVFHKHSAPYSWRLLKSVSIEQVSVRRRSLKKDVSIVG